MKLAALLFAATLVVSFCAITALLFYLHADPSTTELDADLSVVRSQITSAEAEAAKYRGGLLRSMIGLRLEVLRTTENMLEQKKASFVRRVDLTYKVPTTPISASQDRLKQIAEDIAAALAKLEDAEREANQYSGGLIQGLALTTVATHRLTLAQLNLSYLGAKYGFILPQIAPTSGDEKKDEPPGTPVQDRQALE